MVRVVLGFASISMVAALRMTPFLNYLKNTRMYRKFATDQPAFKSKQELMAEGMTEWMADFQVEADRLEQRIKTLNGQDKDGDMFSDEKFPDNYYDAKSSDKFSQRVVWNEVATYVRKWREMIKSSSVKVGDRDFFDGHNLCRVRRLSEELSAKIPELTPLLYDIFVFLRKVRTAYYDREISQAQREYKAYFVGGSQQYQHLQDIRNMLQEMKSENRGQKRNFSDREKAYHGLVGKLFQEFHHAGTFILETNSQSRKLLKPNSESINSNYWSFHNLATFISF